jgi:hypothetical protein
MMDTELRDLKVEWKDITGFGDKLLHVARTGGDGSVKELWLTKRQAQEVARVVSESNQ